MALALSKICIHVRMELVFLQNVIVSLERNSHKEET